MKRFISLTLAVLLILTICIPSFAATKDFVKSIDVKEAITIVDPKGDDPLVVLTPLDSQTPPHDDSHGYNYDDAKSSLKEAYDDIIARGIPSIITAADQEALRKMGIDPSKLIVTDIFDLFSSNESDISATNKLAITFDVHRTLNEKNLPLVMYQDEDGVWHLIDYSNVSLTEAGYLKVLFPEMGSVIFLQNNTPGGTFDKAPTYIWYLIAILSLAAIVIVAVFGFKNRKTNENN